MARKTAVLPFQKPDHKLQPFKSKSSQERDNTFWKYYPLIVKLANQLCEDPLIKEEFIQEGAVGLLEAMDKYDESRGNQPSTYFYPLIKGKMLDYLSKEYEQTFCIESENKKIKTLPLSSPFPTQNNSSEKDLRIEDVIKDNDPKVNPEANVSYSNLIDISDKTCSRMSEQKRQVFSLLYVKDYKPSEISNLLNISRPRVTQLKKAILDNLRPQLSVAP